MRKLILLPCIALLTAAAPANSAPPQVASQAAAPMDSQQSVTLNGGKAAPQAADPKICKYLPSSYTRMTKRTCLTKEEWKQVEREASGD